MDVDEARLKPRFRIVSATDQAYVAGELADYAIRASIQNPIPMRGIPAIGPSCPGRIAGTDPESAACR